MCKGGVQTSSLWTLSQIYMYVYAHIQSVANIFAMDIFQRLGYAHVHVGLDKVLILCNLVVRHHRENSMPPYVYDNLELTAGGADAHCCTAIVASQPLAPSMPGRFMNWDDHTFRGVRNGRVKG